MRKIFFIAAAIFFALTGTTFAARNDHPIGVVIVGGAEFKTPDYFHLVEDAVKPKSGAKLFVGNKMQSQYQKYWINFVKDSGQELTKEHLIDFTIFSGCEKVLFLVISDSNLDRHNNAGSREKDRISLQLDAYLCTNAGIEEVVTAAEQSNSKTSNLRARRGAFKKCLNEVCKTLNKIL